MWFHVTAFIMTPISRKYHVYISFLALRVNPLHLWLFRKLKKKQVDKRQRQWYMITSVCVAHGWVTSPLRQWMNLMRSLRKFSLSTTKSKVSSKHLHSAHFRITSNLSIFPIIMRRLFEMTWHFNSNFNWLVQKQKSYWSFSREEHFTLGTMWIMWTWIRHRKLVWYVHYGF